MSDTVPAKAGRREWLGLAVLALPCTLYAMDLTVLNLAVPHLSAELRPTSSQLLWIVDIYGFVLAGLLITMGTLGDRIGRRRLLLMGAAAFGAASVFAAFSRSAAMLIAARAVLGIAGATLAPSTLSLIRSMFADEDERRVAIGIWVTSFSAGGALGPVVGGLLLARFWWGSVFLIGVPVMLLLLAVGPSLLPEFRDPNAGRMDVASAILSLAAVLLVIAGIKQFAQGTGGWAPAATIIAGIVIAAAFVRRQRRLADPLIDLALFRRPAFSTALAAYTLGTFVAFGMFLYVSQYLQLVRGLSPLRSGLCLLPVFGAFISGSMLAPVIVRRIRPATLMVGGLVLATLGFAALGRVDAMSSVAAIVAGCTVYSLGLAPVFTLATDMIVGAAPAERAGVAAALSETGSELGGALGIALLGSFGTAVYRGGLVAGAPDGIAASATEAARGTLGAAVAIAARLPRPSGAQLVDAARTAFSHALGLTAIICAAIALATGGAVYLMLRTATADTAAARNPS